MLEDTANLGFEVVKEKTCQLCSFQNKSDIKNVLRGVCKTVLVANIGIEAAENGSSKISIKLGLSAKS